MKLAHRQKFSGKARTSFERDRQARWWMEESVSDFLEPYEHDSHGTHVAPVVRGAAVLAEVGAMDRSGEYASLESVGMDREEFSLRPAAESSAQSAFLNGDGVAMCGADVRPAAVVCRASQPSVDLLPKAEGAQGFSWTRFTVGCVLGTAAALGALFILSSIVG